MALTMTNQQREVLAHVVLDPDEWLTGAVAALGEESANAALVAKVARWQSSFEAARTAPDYAPRAQRPGQAPAEIKKKG